MIVDKKNFPEVETRKNTQIFYKKRLVVLIKNLARVVSVEPVLDEGSCWVDLVDYRIRVPIVPRSKHSHLKSLIHHL